MDYEKINIIREEKAKALHIANINGLVVDKTCDTCIWWKRYMLKGFPNTTFMDKKFPCNEPTFVQNATFGEQNKKKTKNNTCERWKYER